MNACPGIAYVPVRVGMQCAVCVCVCMTRPSTSLKEPQAGRSLPEASGPEGARAPAQANSTSFEGPVGEQAPRMCVGPGGLWVPPLSLVNVAGRLKRRH